MEAIAFGLANDHTLLRVDVVVQPRDLLEVLVDGADHAVALVGFLRGHDAEQVVCFETIHLDTLVLQAQPVTR